MKKILFFLLLILMEMSESLAEQRIGYIDGSGTLRVKEGPLSSEWVLQSQNRNLAYPSLTSFRIARFETSGDLAIKEPSLYDIWVTQSTDAAQVAMTENRIGIVGKDGSMRYKDGILGNNFITLYTSGISQVAMSASRIGVLKTDGSFCILEGGIPSSSVASTLESCLRTDGVFCTGPSCPPLALNVTQIALAHQWEADRIGYIDRDGNFFVNEGSVTASFIRQNGAIAVRLIALSNNRIGIVRSDNLFRVKEGNLAAAWVDQITDSGITQIILSGNRIGYLGTPDSNGNNFFAKEGTLDAPWVPQAGEATSIAFSDYSLVTVMGLEEVVFDASAQHCTAEDYPDTPTRAFRDFTGQTQLIIAHHKLNHRMTGQSLNSLNNVDCTNLLPSVGNVNPDARNDRLWLHGGMYTLDGNTIVALVHNEYHGGSTDLHPNNPYCPRQEIMALGLDPTRTCFKASTTMAISIDRGVSYSGDGKGNPYLPSVAWLPFPYDNTVDIPFLGLYEPTNFVRSGNYYYAMVRAGEVSYREQGRGSCLIRTDNILDPASWRAYDGTGFNIAFYKVGTQGATCPTVLNFLNPRGLGTQQLVFNTYLNRFMLIGWNRGVHMFVATSSDLTTWSNPTQVTGLSWPAWLTVPGTCTGFECPKAYATILDPNDASQNYEMPGQNVGLYYTRFNEFINNDTGGIGPNNDRDLVRLPIQFHK